MATDDDRGPDGAGASPARGVLRRELDRRGRGLSTLMRLTHLLEDEDVPLESILERFAADVAAIFLHPERVSARIHVGPAAPEGLVQRDARRLELSLGLFGGRSVVIELDHAAGGDGAEAFTAAERELLLAAAELLRSVLDRRLSRDELRRLDRARRMLGECNAILVRAAREQELFAAVCRTLVERGGYVMAWVGMAEAGAERLVRPVAVAGFERGYLEAARITWDEGPRGQGPVGVALRSRRRCAVRDVLQDPAFEPWREEARRRGYRSLIALPLALDGGLGVLAIYAGEPDAFDGEEAALLEELADDLVFGVGALRRESQLRAVFAATQDGMVILDDGGRVVEVNDAAQRLLARSRDRLLGQELPFERLTALLAGAPGTSAAAVPIALARQDGTTVEMECEVTRSFEPGRHLLVLRDVTERRRAEERLRQAERLTTLGSLVSGVAHELNNPLTVISGGAQLLAVEEEVAPHVRARLEQIHEQALRAARIVRNLLTFARQTPPRRRPVDLPDVLDRALDLLGYRLRVNGIRVLPEYASDLRRVSGDSDQLLQVMVNLLNNAIDALCEDDAEGGRELRLRARGSGGGSVRIEVADNGPGIPPGIHSRLFDPFFTTKPAGQGTGLGLPICYGIVQAHGGEIWAEPRAGRGATFVIELPAGSAASESEATPPKPAMAAAETGSVLVVDDEVSIAELVADVLGRLGFTVVTAPDGAAALDYVAGGGACDAILLDMKMPGMDGRRVWTELRATRPEVARRVVFMTGDVVSAGTREFLESTGNRYIAKPFDLGDMTRAIRATLTSTRD